MTPYWSDMVEFFLDSLVLIFPVTIKIELRLGLILVVKLIKMVFSISATTMVLFVWSQRSKIHRSSNIYGPWYIHSFRLFFLSLLLEMSYRQSSLCLYFCLLSVVWDVIYYRRIAFLWLDLFDRSLFQLIL